MSYENDTNFWDKFYFILARNNTQIQNLEKSLFILSEKKGDGN